MTEWWKFRTDSGAALFDEGVQRRLREAGSDLVKLRDHNDGTMTVLVRGEIVDVIRPIFGGELPPATYDDLQDAGLLSLDAYVLMEGGRRDA